MWREDTQPGAYGSEWQGMPYCCLLILNVVLKCDFMIRYLIKSVMSTKFRFGTSFQSVHTPVEKACAHW